MVASSQKANLQFAESDPLLQLSAPRPMLRPP